jgi:hypothetical protein
MQKADTSTIDAKAVVTAPKVNKLIEIGIDDKNMVYVNWPVDKKDVCLTALCEALKLVSTYKQAIIEAPKPHLMDFVRGLKR